MVWFVHQPQDKHSGGMLVALPRNRFAAASGMASDDQKDLFVLYLKKSQHCDLITIDKELQAAVI